MAQVVGTLARGWTHRVRPGDLGPWNILARDGEPVAIMDWDDAGPIGHVWDLANVVWLNAHLHDDDVAALHGLPSAEDRMRQARLILDGYRLAARDRIGFRGA